MARQRLQISLAWINRVFVFILYHKRPLQIRYDYQPADVSINRLFIFRAIFYIQKILFLPCRLFLKVKTYFAQQSESLPMSLVLGFYVNLVVKRWWEQYRLLPWPDTLALFISAAIPNSNGGVNVSCSTLMNRPDCNSPFPFNHLEWNGAPNET